MQYIHRIFTKKITYIALVISFKNFESKVIFVILIKIGDGGRDFSPIGESGIGMGTGTGQNPRWGNWGGDGLNRPRPHPRAGINFPPRARPPPLWVRGLFPTSG